MAGKPNNNITFIIFAHNEEHRIGYPIKCFSPYGEVLVVNHLSKDKTSDIARGLGARVIDRDNSKQDVSECQEEADFVFKHVYTDWVFWGYADEMVPETCLKKYCEIVEKTDYKIVVQKSKTMLYRPEMELLSTNAAIKLFKINSIEFLPNGTFIHGMGKIADHIQPEDICFLPPLDEYAVHHFSVYNSEKLMANHNSYSTLHSKLIPKRYLWAKIFVQPLISFATIYFVQGSFRWGVRGFIAAVQYSYYHFQVLAKAYEKYNDINLIGIESNFKKEKELMLAESPKSSWTDRVLAEIKNCVFSRAYLYKKKIGRKIK